MSDARGGVPGFHGKVRTHGDFVSRRLPPAFTLPWDQWLQRGMLFAQQWFAAQWLPVYLNAPLWHFALGAGGSSASAWAGVLMPGVDRVGRYFPFTIAAPLRQDMLAAWLHDAQDWYDEAARLALSTLADDFVLERFDRALNAMPPAGGGGGAGAGAGAGTGTGSGSGSGAGAGAGAGTGTGTGTGAGAWRLRLADGAPGGGAFAERLAESVTGGRGAWWSEGSEAVPPTLRVSIGLPDAQQFAGLLDAACPGWPTVVPLRL